MIDPKTIDAIRSKANIVDVIGHYIPVSKKGKNYVAVCPFHDDHDPSMSINEAKQIYKCFVCGEGGNVFTFVQHYEKIGFAAAVAKVGELVGIHVDTTDNGNKPPTDPRIVNALSALDQMSELCNFELRQTRDPSLLSYLDKRDINADVISTFKIGYDASDDQVSTFLSKKGVEETVLVGANISTRGYDGKLKDVFSRRLIFPIDNIHGQTIGFTARSMDPDNDRKYINTSETPVFKKGELVYNSSRAKDAARKQGGIILVEGVMDVIAFWKAGIENVVCTLGTACTKDQLNIIRTLSNHLILAYDGDRAGQNAIYKAGNVALSMGMRLSVLNNPTKLDPDEIYMQKGKDALAALATSTQTWLEFVYGYIKGQYDLNQYSARKDFVNAMLPHIKASSDPLDRQAFTKRLESDSGFDLSQMIETTRNASIASSAIQPGKAANGSNASPAVKTIPTRMERIQSVIISQMLMDLKAQALYTEKLNFLPDPKYSRIAALILNQCRKGELVNINQIMDHCENDTQRVLLSQIAFDVSLGTSYNKQVLEAACVQLDIEIKRQHIASLRRELSNEIDPNAKKALEKQISSLYQDINSIKEANRERH